MQIFDVSTNAIINETLHFDEVSVKLYSVKTLAIKTTSNVTAKLQDSTNFKFAIAVDNELSLLDNTIIVKPTNGVATINIVFVANTDAMFDNLLTINNQQIMLHASAIDENSKYAVQLSNHKFYIDDMFVKTFKDSNVDEHYIDYKLLNEKRKELLIDLFSIKSFVGTYAGLIDALKFFGYDDDVIIKEFWTFFDKSINDYRLSRHSIETDVSTLPDGYQKTNMFNLTYHINDITGFYGDDNLPAIEQIFANEISALVKMQNLRNILETYFLPAHAIIVDVIGEHLNFSAYKTSYYIHNAIINYYDTELSRLFNVTQQIEHQTLAVKLSNELLDFGEILDKDVVKLDAVNVELQVVDEYPTKYYVNNFAFVKFTFTEQWFANAQRATFQVINSKNVIVFEYDMLDIVDNTFIIGFLADDTYKINISMLDKYNTVHIHKHEITTIFVKHDFDTFTAVNDYNTFNLEKREVFPSCKEALEYFEWYDNATNKLADLQSRYFTGLQLIEAYNSNFTSNVFASKDASQYNLLNTLISLATPYRGFTNNEVYLNEFNVNLDKYDVDDKLAKQFNKAFVTIYYGNVSAKDNNLINITVNNKNIQFRPDVVQNVSFLVSARNKFYQLKLSNPTELGDLANFDCEIIKISEDDSNVYVDTLIFVSKSVVDVNAFSCNHTYNFKQLIGNDYASTIVNVLSTTQASRTTALEFVINNVSYSMVTEVSNASELIEAIVGLQSIYSNSFTDNDIVIETIKIDNDNVLLSVNSDFVFRINSNYYGSSVKQKAVDLLFKLEPGDDVMQYSIVVAAINESSKCKPYDIKWKLYEDSGNDVNLISVSTNYMFSEVLLSKSSYTLELEYKDRLKSDTKIVRKQGVFLTANNKYKQLIEPFIESQFKFDI